MGEHAEVGEGGREGREDHGVVIGKLKVGEGGREREERKGIGRWWRGKEKEREDRKEERGGKQKREERKRDGEEERKGREERQGGGGREGRGGQVGEAFLYPYFEADKWFRNGLAFLIRYTLSGVRACAVTFV